MTKGYPRVLLLSRTGISEFNAQGAARGGWFRNWPKSHLGHVFSSPVRGDEDFCDQRYLLTGAERYGGRLFDRAKAGATSDQVRTGGQVQSNSRLVGRVKGWAKRMLVDSGLWEILFPPRLSTDLEAWVTEFRPDVMYAAVTDLSYMRFALLLHERFGIPFCIHIDDDWPATMYRDSPFRLMMVPLLRRTYQRLLKVSRARLSNGQPMTIEYQARYGVTFEPLMMCDEALRFQQAAPTRTVPKDTFHIIYSGNLELNRWRSMVDLFSAVGALRNQGMKIHVTVYTGTLSKDMTEAFQRYPWVQIEPAPRHDNVPGILRGADLLFLTEGFSREFYDYIRLSISAKSHLYMFSGTPTLVYGPSGVGVIEYARTEGWAFVVDREDRNLLQMAIARLHHDGQLRSDLARQAQAVGVRNHDAERVRSRLLELLTSIANKRNANADMREGVTP